MHEKMTRENDDDGERLWWTKATSSEGLWELYDNPRQDKKGYYRIMEWMFVVHFIITDNFNV